MDNECKECGFWYADPLIDDFGFAEEYCHCYDPDSCPLEHFNEMHTDDLPEGWNE